MTVDLSDFYLESHLPPANNEYVHIPVWMICPADIQALYHLTDKTTKDGHVYAKILHGMYGLPQAGKLAHEQLEQFLQPHGFLVLSPQVYGKILPAI